MYLTTSRINDTTMPMNSHTTEKTADSAPYQAFAGTNCSRSLFNTYPIKKVSKIISYCSIIND